MYDCVFICQVISRPQKIDLVINSRYTYLNAELICSLRTEQAAILSYRSNQFNLYEGEQLYSIRHGFSKLDISTVMLTIEIVDHNRNCICCYNQYSQENAQQDAPSLINVSGEISRQTEGGSITIEVGGIPFRIHSHYNGVLQQLKDYITKEKPICDITIKEEEILRIKEEFDKTCKYPPTKSEIEMYAVRQVVSESILDFNCFQIHGAAFAVDNCGYIFTADSGTGKTTHMQLWLKNLNNAYVVNGDQPIVKVVQNIMVCGSPWCGKEGLNSNVAVPLKAIIIMERSNENSIVEISMSEALIELIRQVYRPSDSVKMSKTLQLLSALEGKVKFYRFKFDNFADDAFSVSYKKVHMGQ